MSRRSAYSASMICHCLRLSSLVRLAFSKLLFGASLPRRASSRHLITLIALALSLAIPQSGSAEEGLVDLPRFPSISPDGAELVFSWGGDLWRVSSEGGQARRLTQHTMDDLYSSWSPDGEWITFSSMRDGYLNLWRIHRDGTQLTQLTHADRFIRNPAYGLDEQGEAVITFSGDLEGDVYREQRPYQISPQGGEHGRLHGAYGSTPQLSPDGTRTVFTRGGYYHDWGRRHYRGPDAKDVWLHDRENDSFEAITTWEGDDGSAQWQDENTLIFMSDRALDTVNLYRADLTNEEREFERLTDFDERDIQGFDVSRDGSTAVVHVWDTLYTLDLDDPDAEPVALTLRAGDDGHDDYTLRRVDRDVTEAELSPDGRVMAYIAYGRVYVRHMDEHSPTRAVTPGSHARHRNISWSPDGVRLYFSSDQDGTESIYQADVALTREEIREEFRGVEAQEQAEATTEEPEATEEETQESIVFDPLPEPLAMALEDPERPEPDEDPTPRMAEPDDPFGPIDPNLPFDPRLPDPGLEPDPEPTQEPVVEPETIPEIELDIEPKEEVPVQLDPTRWHDGVQFRVRPLVQTRYNDRDVSPSPDGQSIAFRRGLGDLAIMDLETRDVRILVDGWDHSIQWRWSPDSRHIAYSQNDLDFSANIFIVPADGSHEPVNITRHPRNDLNPRWSADGRILTFISNRSAETYDLYRVYLDREIDNYSPRQLATYYRDTRNAAAQRQPLPASPDAEAQEFPDVELDLDDAWRRVSRVTSTPTHQYGNEMTPGGDLYLFNSGGQGLMAMRWDGGDRKRLGPTANVQHMSLRGDQLVTVADGRVTVVGLGDRGNQRPELSDRIRINLREESLQKFREAARMIGESFYQTDMKGLDWEAVTEDYAELIERARTSSEFSDIANRLMGELAASHMGVSDPGPASALRQPSGRLGVEYEHIILDNGHGAYRVTGVVPDGPADIGPMRLRPGDVITAVDLEPFEPTDTLLERLRGQVGEEIIITFERRIGRRQVENRALLIPVDFNQLARLKYDAFRMESEEQVDELSEGRLGYLHIQAMNQASLEGFQADLYAAAQGKEGLIIDVRNNGGGHTTDRILTSITAPDHAYTIPAGADESEAGHYPQDRLHAPRYTLPINMLANEKSYSNAEILAHAFTTLDRGTLVGEQTYGGVISTGSYSLINGATVRRPFRGWYMPDGTDMEHNGAMPDLLVEQAPEDEIADHDRQLDVAVETLLERLDEEER